MTTDNIAEMTPEQLRDELAATKRVAQLWFRKATERKKELTQARAKIGQLCDRISNIAGKRDDMEDKLAQAHIELRQIRKFWLNPAGAVELWRQLARMEAGRDFWYKEAKDAEIELDRVRQDAQDQSDEVQELWLSPVEAEGLKRQLAKAQVQSATPKEAAVWLWGFYDGNTLIAKPGYEDDIREAWDKLLIAVDSIAGDALLERLATLDTAEAALADCGISGIYDEFTGLTDAIEQMTQYIDELTREDRRRTEQVKTLQAEWALRQVAETGERAARKLLSQAIVAQADAELAAHVHSKAYDELTQTVHTERQLRQEAEQRAETAEAANDHLRSVASQVSYLKDRAERAEALAQLVNEETAELVERLAGLVHKYAFGKTAGRARALAAKIREALDDSQT